MFCEKNLSINKLLKLKDIEHSKNFFNDSTPNLKNSIGKTKKIAREPDFIGIDLNNEYHILETKCRLKYNKAEHQHALNQVQMINQVKGKNPLTRVACYFSVSKKNTTGYIVDPENEGQFNLEFNLEEFIKTYYGIFLKLNSENSFIIRYDSRLYNLISGILPGYYFGIEESVKINAKEGRESEDYRRYYLETNKDEILESKSISIGPDGIILIDMRESVNHFIKFESCPKQPNNPLIHWW